MIVLFTDFGTGGPYIGQMKAVLLTAAPGVPIIDLLHDLPPCDIETAAYLLAAYSRAFPDGSTFLTVVDPGVGSERRALLVEADSYRYVAPDNGLLELVMRRATRLRVEEIVWRPAQCSASFHGRDLFAPVAARAATSTLDRSWTRTIEDPLRKAAWPDELPRVIYCDRYGNAVTGVRAEGLPEAAVVEVNGTRLPRARTFSRVAIGEPFWYENSNGLLEIAVNQGSAMERLGIQIGSEVTILD